MQRNRKIGLGIILFLVANCIGCYRHTSDSVRTQEAKLLTAERRASEEKVGVKAKRKEERKLEREKRAKEEAKRKEERRLEKERKLKEKELLVKGRKEEKARLKQEKEEAKKLAVRKKAQERAKKEEDRRLEKERKLKERELLAEKRAQEREAARQRGIEKKQRIAQERAEEKARLIEERKKVRQLEVQKKREEKAGREEERRLDAEKKSELRAEKEEKRRLAAERRAKEQAELRTRGEEQRLLAAEEKAKARAKREEERQLAAEKKAEEKAKKEEERRIETERKLKERELLARKRAEEEAKLRAEKEEERRLSAERRAKEEAKRKTKGHLEAKEREEKARKRAEEKAIKAITEKVGKKAEFKARELAKVRERGIETYLSKGESYYRANQFAEATKEFEEVLTLDPENKRAKDYLARTEEDEEAWLLARAEAEEEKRERGRKERISEHIDKGMEYCKQGLFSEAIAEWERVMPLTDPIHPKRLEAEELIHKARQSSLERASEEVAARNELARQEALLQVEQKWLPEEKTEQEIVEKGEVEGDKKGLERKSQKLVSLEFVDAHLRDVLTYLSDVSEVNIVLDETVFPAEGIKTGEGVEEIEAAEGAGMVTSPRVTIRLRNIPLTQALDVILRAKGLTYRLEENLVWITTPENLAKEQMVTKIYHLSTAVGGLTRYEVEREFKKEEEEEIEEW